MPVLLSFLIVCLLAVTASVNAVEDPPGCSLANGGAGNTSQGGINFNLPQAHVGDTVPVFPSLGMANNACRAINATGVVYLATGPLTNFLLNVTLNPGELVSCPFNAKCSPGPYNVFISPAVVGAAVISPNGGVPGVAKTVRAVENGFGTVLAGAVDEQLSDFHSASIQIVTPCIQVFKFCDLPPGQTCFPAQTPVRFRGYVTNCGDITLTNVTVIDNRAGQMQLFNSTNGSALTGDVILPPGAYAVFSNSFQPTLQETCAGSATNVIVATATDTTVIGGPNASVTNSYTGICPICSVPAIAITKQCPAGPVEPGGVLTYSGSVSNAGNITLTNVTVVNNQPANNTPVIGPITLVPGAVFAFTNSYTVPLDSCGPYVDTLTVRASTTCGAIVSNTATASCAYTNSPSIVVTKRCPDGLLQPGQTNVVTGTVTNTGNITLTNVVVTNTIAALGNVSRRVLGPISLAPGAGASFSDSYTIPLDSCGPYRDTFAASGADKCFGRIVTDSDFKDCPGTNSPSIDVVKACPAGLVQPGQLLTVTGTVTNTGNITLTNVVVTNTIAALGNLSRRVLGPIDLAPGAGTTFSDSYTVPLDSCGPYRDTFAASGADKCFGRVVTDSDFKDCPGTNSPSIEVVKACPAGPVQPGQTMTVTGTVTNTGNITLTNVVVTNTITALGNVSRRVLGPISLAPGAGASFSDSYTIPLDSCGPYSDTFAASGADKCFGRVVTDSDSQDCPGTNSPSIDVVKTCPAGPVQPGQTMTVSGTVTNTGNITLTNVVVTNTIAALGNVSRRVLGPISLAPGAEASFSDSYTIPLDSCGPYRDTFAASGADKCFGRIVTDSDFKDCPGTNSPSIDVVKACPAGLVQPGQLLTVTGTVTNTGNITLTNVVVTNTIAALGNLSRRVLGPIDLAPGAGTTFSDSYTVPLDSCGPYRDTFAASGADKCFGRVVTDSDFKDCPGTNSPSIEVVKACPAGLVQPGQLLTVTGTVTNTGNITLTNVVVTNTITALGNVSRRVLGPISLAPGAGASFSDSYPIPLDSCGPYSDTFAASGADKCFGRVVTDSDSQDCPGTNSPSIDVVKTCPAGPVQPGQTMTVSGTVTNTGNITLTNVVVTNTIAALGNVSRRVLGPISLAPGAGASFSDSYTIPLDSCGPYADTFAASGADKCFGRVVTDSDTKACPGTNSPGIDVVKACPAGPVQPGQTMTVSGTVTNTGNITLTNVVVTNTIAALGNVSRRVLGPIDLAPGAGASFSDSYTIPLDSCGPYADTFVASGADKCFGRVVTDSDTKACPGTNSPSIDVVKACPAGPVQPGQTMTVSGTVTNTGNITLTNVVVTNTITALGNVSRRVLGPIDLAPGAGTTFSDSYTVPLDSCGPYRDTFAASGADKCFGRVVTDSDSQDCPGTNSPSIDVVKTCPAGPVQPGQTMTVSGTVTNTGNITLTNVVVTNTIAALSVSRRVLGPISLAPGAGASFSDSYTIPLDSCGPYADTFVASGADKCFGRVVTDSDTKACPGTNSPSIDVVKACPAGPVQPGQTMTVSGTVTNTGNITLTNVVVTNTITALGNVSRRVLGPISLAPGAGTTFSDSYTVPLDSCGPYADTFAASGADKCFGRVVTDSDTKACPGTNSPSIEVVKACPAGPVEPGRTMTVTGTVTNTGNITLTNVVVTNTIAALGNVSRRVLGPINLAPGAGANFSDSYTIPLDSCGPYADTFAASGADKCFGRVVTDSDFRDCPGTNSPSIDVVKTCPAGPVQPGQTMTVTGTVTNTGNITLTNVVVTNTIAALGNVSRRVLGPISLAPGSGASFSDSYTIPLDSCGPYTDTFAASGADKCFGRVVTDSDTKACPGTNNPVIDVVKVCPTGPVQPGQLLTVSGTVSNAGNVTLNNVIVSNTIAALGNISRRVLGPISLQPGNVTSFSDSYIVPLDSCGPYADTVTASGADKCFLRVVTDSDTKACPGTNSPSIDVVKTCPAGLVQPGQLLTVTGTVTNTGNITLTNVVVTNTIAALGNLSRRVLGPISLAPRAGASFSDSYTVPLDSCGPYADTFAASGADKCFGRLVTDSDTRACPGTNSPRIYIAKYCPAVPVAPNQITTVSGVVSNWGNITLTNVLVFDDQPSNNTPLLGPISLAPGQAVFFTNSYLLPPNCCTYVDTVRATGRDKCFGRTVTDSATAVCPTVTNPRLTVTKTCPPLPVPLGQPLVFSGVVSNAGNITLTNVTVVNSQPSNNTPVLGPIDLAPGERASFTGAYRVPADICETNILDTVTARGNSICNGINVSASQSATCPILPRPLLVVTKNCPPNPVPPGGLLTFSGSVSNAGNITLTNVIVVNDHPTNNTPVLGPVTLVPNQSLNFSGSYQVCPECCPPYVDTISASGAQICNGSNVAATATAHCPGISRPQITLTVECPPAPALLGQLLFYSGSVSNSGDVTLSGVDVTDNKTGFLTQLPALAPAETADFFGFYLATNCGPNVITLVTATAFDVCTGGSVSNQLSASCAITCPSSRGPLLTDPTVGGGQFKFSFATELGRTYSVQYTDSLMPVNWQSAPSFIGDGSIVTITDTTSHQQRFYRVLVQ